MPELTDRQKEILRRIRLAMCALVDDPESPDRFSPMDPRYNLVMDMIGELEELITSSQ